MVRTGQLTTRHAVVVAGTDASLDRAKERTDQLTLPGWSFSWVSAAESYPAQGRRRRLRALVARAGAHVAARRSGADPAMVWALKSSPSARAALRSADVILSADEASERALVLLPDVTGVTPKVQARRLDAALLSMATLADVLSEVVDAKTLTDGHVAAWRERISLIDAELCPLGAEMAAEAARITGARRHRVLRARLLNQVLDLPAWPTAQRLATGLAARRWSADLTTGLRQPNEVNRGKNAAEVTAAVEAVLTSADDALGAEDFSRAFGRLTAGMDLLFHRARHAEVTWSPLVDDPCRYLSALASSASWRALTARAAERAEPPVERAGSRQRPRVLVLTGAYGDFHRPIADALRQSADVEVVDAGHMIPALREKLVDEDVLPALAEVIAHEEGVPRFGRTAPLDKDRRAIELLRAKLTQADIVLSDWADRATVWASHLCPPSTRFVVRVHSLDLLDPWFHLVRWDRVDHLVAVSEPMASLARDLLRVQEAEVPVTVLPNLVAVAEMDVPKQPVVRTTMGMVAWGRKVKDPQWALDLLERNPSWRLVLIGPDFPADPGPMIEDYVRRFRERLQQPSLAARVDMTGDTEDVAGALTGVGIILSASLREGMPVGLFEGAASGAVPVVRDWPLLSDRGGARSVVPPEWVVEDVAGAEERIRSVTSTTEAWERTRREVQRLVREAIDPAGVAEMYRALVLGRAGE